ncbi:hypothetical protein PMAYCL1PPCAC_29289, partial [Pristionchus mayeri]
QLLLTCHSSELLAMSTRDRSGRGRSRWNTEDDMDISNSDDERKSRSQHTLRDGILFSNSNYYQFLIKWVAEISLKNPAREKILKETISQATLLERERINLAPHEKVNVLHCDITVKGLPPSVFYGSGYGSERKTAYFAAAKDLMDKCLKMGIITRDLHEAIGNKPSLEPNRRLPDFVRALDVIYHLDSRIAKASWRDKVEQKRSLSPMDFVQLDQLIAESRERVYGVNAPVYDSSFCGLCKRKTHTETCPYGVEEKRLAKLRKAQEEREMARRERRGRSRSRSREKGRDPLREQKERERLEIERKILEQREALAREDEERKLREVTERARAAALAYGGGGIPMVGGPGAAPLVTPGLSGSANPIGMMMHSVPTQPNPPPFANPFHPLNPLGPSPEMVASMAQFAAMMDPTGGGYGKPPQTKEPVTVPTGYAAHVQALEEQRVRMEAEDMARRAAMERERREREETERREKTEAALRAEMEARLHEEIEQKRREMEMELREKLAPREARRLGDDFGAAMSAYGVNVPVSTPLPTQMHVNPYGVMPNPQHPFSPYPHSSPYGLPSMATNVLGTPNPYSLVPSMQQSMTELPEFIEIKSIVNDNADTLKNLAYTRDSNLTNHPVLIRVGNLGGSVMSQMELRQLRDELKDFLAMLQRKVEDGRAKGLQDREVKMERGRDERERREVDQRRRRSRSRSYERRHDRRGRGSGGGGGSYETVGTGTGGGWAYDKPKEVELDSEDVEVIVQVGGNRFRQLRAKEAMELKKDDIVVAQDLKSGKWSTAKVLRVSEKRVQLTVGNAMWKKEFNEVYTPI